MTTETTPINILHRYTDYSALITLGHGYTCPTRATKKHLIELLETFEDDEELYISQIDVPERPLIIKPVGCEEPAWMCLCENEVQ